MFKKVAKYLRMLKNVAKFLRCTKATIQHPEEAEGEAWIYNGQEEVPPTVRRVKIAENVTAIPDEAFLRLLERAIGEDAFSLREQFKIPDGAFEKHRQLEEVILSSSVQVIGRGAFGWCRNLNSILYQGLENEEVGIPPNVRVIDSSAFEYCTSLARLVLNEGLEEIGCEAFIGCNSLTEVEIPSTVRVIHRRAFSQCRLLARLVLNEGLELIGEAAFEDCDCLTRVDVPSTVEVIDDHAFYECKLLAGLGLHEGLERIGKNSFFGCKSLSHVRIPRSVDSIAYNAFVECSSMISIELPEEWSFDIDLSRCQSLVNLAGPMPTFNRDIDRE
eukprot:scaffold4394_cov138-Cylindrotheca_fusiformis.AAC.1